MKRFLVISASALALAGCDMPANPVVAEYNGDSVTIVTSSFSNQEEARAKSQAEANRICQRGHRKRAEYVSTRTNPQTYEQAHLYLCLN